MDVILGVETSCDETGVAIIEGGRGSLQRACTDVKFKILSQKLSSSIDLQREFGGVVPELASRVHVERINILMKEALSAAGMGWGDIDAIAVANGPGLVGALLVGTMTAKTISLVTGKPLISVNHLEGHVYSAFIERLRMTNDELRMDESAPPAPGGESGIIKFPILVLIVSGGHTELVLMNDFGDYQIIGSTIDDAAGEAFDKAARILGLPYPGGPSISNCVDEYLKNKKITNYELRITNEYKLPRPMLDSGDYVFSFSGLKTALLYKWRDTVGAGSSRPDIIPLLSYEFQEAVVDVLVEKTRRAASEFRVENIAIVGGVAANKRLRQRMKEEFGKNLITPPINYCTDNGLKIAVAGMLKYLKKNFTRWQDLEVRADWEL